VADRQRTVVAALEMDMHPSAPKELRQIMDDIGAVN
jgi:hypothetical protein